MTTIRDVAKHANVAPITVSRVINNSGYVSEETRLRVTESIDKLGYVPNRLARSLRLRQTNLIALVLTDITNPFWTTVARGVEDAASDAGLSVIVCNTDESQIEEDKYLRLLVERQVDGILLVPASSRTEAAWFIRKHNVPVVILDRRLPERVADVVRCDSDGGAYQLVRLLTSLGHRRIAALSGPQKISTAADRVTGYRRALHETGIEEDERLIFFGEYTVQSGYAMAKLALQVTPPPSAFFAANNFIAIGAFAALRDHKLRVPEDIALVSFDDIPSTLFYDPFLTVVSQPSYDMGRRAIEVLLARLAHELPDEYQDFVLPTELIVRKSSGQAR